jgi:hypothetical protein
MEYLKASQLFEVATYLGRVSQCIAHIQETNPGTSGSTGLPEVQKSLAELRRICRHDGLKVSRAQIGEFIRFLKRGNNDVHTLRSFLDRVSSTIRIEMEQVLFLHIGHDAREYFESDNLFGPSVAKAFPSIMHDIAGAGKCLATEQPHASVFHVMRVMEFGLQRLQARLKVKSKNPNWHKVLEAIETEINRRDNLPQRPKAWTKQRVFYTEAASHFMFFKDIRNRAVHIDLPVRQYVAPDDKAALRIFNEVKHFMQHLATKLKERQKTTN